MWGLNMDRQKLVKKRRITIMAIPVILLLFVIGVLGYGFCIYNGYLLLNNPSKKQYPVSGIDLSHYQGEVDWPVRHSKI